MRNLVGTNSVALLLSLLLIVTEDGEEEGGSELREEGLCMRLHVFGADQNNGVSFLFSFTQISQFPATSCFVPLNYEKYRNGQRNDDCLALRRFVSLLILYHQLDGYAGVRVVHSSD